MGGFLLPGRGLIGTKRPITSGPISNGTLLAFAAQALIATAENMLPDRPYVSFGTKHPNQFVDLDDSPLAAPFAVERQRFHRQLVEALIADGIAL